MTRVTLTLLATILCLWLLLPVYARAAVAVDSTNASIANANNTTSVAWSHVAASNSNQILLVCAGAGSSTSGTTHASGVTFGSDTLTEVPSSFVYDGWDGVSLWYKLTPTVQTANITITFPAIPTMLSGIAAALNGVDVAGTPLGTANKLSGSSAAPSVSISSATGELVVACISSDSESGITEGGTLVKKQIGILADTSYGMEYYAGASSVSATYTQANTGWAIAGVSFKPSGVASAETFGFRRRRAP